MGIVLIRNSNRRTVRSILLGFFLLQFTTSCFLVSKSKSSSASLPNYLRLTGQIVTEGEVPVPSASIFVEGSDAVITTSNADGSFEILLDETSINRVAGSLQGGRSSFYCFFEQMSTPTLAGVSPIIGLTERGEKNLGKIVIKAAASIEGIVLGISSGQDVGPVANATISVGRGKVLSQSDGSFKVSDLPAGRLSFTVSAPEFSPYSGSIELLPGESKSMEEPIVLFCETGLVGTLIPIPSLPDEQLSSLGHQFSRSFLVKASKDAAFIRYASMANGGDSNARQNERGHDRKRNRDRDAFTEDDGWIPLPKKIDYDFPGNGGHTLYYQFADQNKTTLSGMGAVNVVLNLFESSKGIVIEDGSGVVFRRNVMLHIDLPPAAAKMRLSDNIDTLTAKPWQEPKDLIEFIFFPLLPLDGTLVPPPISLEEVFCQFADAFGQESVVFRASATLDLFPSQGIVIEDGSGVVNRRDVKVTVDVPPAAVRMRFAETIGELALKLWEPAQPITQHAFSIRLEQGSMGIGKSVDGLRELYCQFADDQGSTSAVFKTSVRLELFPSVGNVFMIEGGAELTRNKLVSLEIQVPENAYEMRVFESAGSNDGMYTYYGVYYSNMEATSENYWVTAQSFYYFAFSSAGNKTLYVQFRDLEGVMSPMFQQVIRVLPYPPGLDPIGFIINGGASVSPSRYVELALTPPATAIAFKVFEGNYNQMDRWTFLQPIVPYTATSSGLLTLHVQYLNIDLEESPVYSQTIEILPFDPTEGDVVINNGAVTTTSPTVSVHITAPACAAYMAVSQLTPPADDLSTVWTPVYSSVQVTLQGTGGFGTGGPGVKTVYVRFKNIEGELSAVFQDSIIYEPFPFGSGGVEINGGAAYTSSTDVTLSIQVPSGAVGMRISSIPEAIETLPFTETASTTPYTIPAEPGVHKVYVQFVTQAGDMSVVYFDDIMKY